MTILKIVLVDINIKLDLDLDASEKRPENIDGVKVVVCETDKSSESDLSPVEPQAPHPKTWILSEIDEGM